MKFLIKFYIPKIMYTKNIQNVYIYELYIYPQEMWKGRYNYVNIIFQNIL